MEEDGSKLETVCYKGNRSPFFFFKSISQFVNFELGKEEPLCHRPQMFARQMSLPCVP